MEPKSAGLRASARLKCASATDRRGHRRRVRLPAAERRAQILGHAADFFAEYGLTAQTRALAEACGISQRLLYRFFHNKSELIEEVYRQAILGPFKGVWLPQLQDRTRPLEERLIAFYVDYFHTVLTRKWLRLFLYSSLAEERMAPDYIAQIIKGLMETVVAETCAALGLRMPDDVSVVHELGWTLHGNISHFAIRRHLYHASQDLPVARVIAFHVRAFLAGFPAMLSANGRESVAKATSPSLDYATAPRE